jgi:hypothetical protein
MENPRSIDKHRAIKIDVALTWVASIDHSFIPSTALYGYSSH